METEANSQETSPLTFEAMWWGTLGSVQPFPNFHPERDVTVLHTALEKKDVSTIVRLLTNRSNELDASLKKVLSGPSLTQSHGGLSAGTDEETLLEILCTRIPQQLSDIRAAYSQGALGIILLNKENGPGIFGPGYSSESIYIHNRFSLSEELKNQKPAADIWIKLLTTRNQDHLRTVLEELEFEKGQTVEDALEGHFKGVLSGDLKKALKTLVQCIQNQYLFLAQRLQTMKSPVVQGVMVALSEEDLLRVRVAYLQSTGTSLYTALQKQFKGELQQGLLDC
uniref:Zgc:101785 n=1 Tax=Sinocyclocheilus grahami TaxID=75366 RepID=A0A672TA64_SINGR